MVVRASCFVFRVALLLYLTQTLLCCMEPRWLHRLYRGRPPRHCSCKGIKRVFRTVLRETGISDFRFHDLRHCAATNLRRAGVDTATAMQIVGHKSDKMWKRYNAIKESDLLHAAKKLNAYLETSTLLTPPLRLESLIP